MWIASASGARYLARLVGMAAVGAALLTGVACQRAAKEPAPAETAPPLATPQRTGVEILASASGNLVLVALTNHNQEPLLVGPKHFAILNKGERKLMPFRMGADFAQFPIKELQKGETVSGYLRFAELKDLVGSEIVFQGPPKTYTKQTITLSEGFAIAPPPKPIATPDAPPAAPNN